LKNTPLTTNTVRVKSIIMMRKRNVISSKINPDKVRWINVKIMPVPIRRN
jgi:hypothetical protein